MNFTRYRWLIWTAAAWLVLRDAPAPAKLIHADPRKDRALADALFTNGLVLNLRIEIPEAGMASLRKDPRKHVNATLREGDAVYTDVAIHLKGSAGSFRNVDDAKPGLTLSLSKFEASSKFHGLDKFHLNNSVQDPAYLSEWICAEMFRAAGVPATRVAHALVEINGKKRGLYVIKESFEKDFLAQYFRNVRGNIYGQPGGADVNQPLERIGGEGENTRSDLKALTAAAQEPDATRRWERLRQVLDVERFLSFMAMEIMLCHWDGYTFAQHNYRVYHDLDADKMVFFPHDMDQMMSDPNVPIMPGVAGLIAQAIMNTPQTRPRYRERFGVLFTNVFQLPRLTNRIDWMTARLVPTLKAYDPGLAREFENNAVGLKNRIIARAQSLDRQFNLPETKPLLFTNGIARLAQWRTQNGLGNATLEQTKAGDKTVLHIRCEGGECVASWRTSVLLESGKYRFAGRVKIAGVVAQPGGEPNNGGGLRISGDRRKNALSGNADWTRLEHEFLVEGGRTEKVMVCELRATKGEIWFDADSLQLERVK